MKLSRSAPCLVIAIALQMLAVGGNAQEVLDSNTQVEVSMLQSKVKDFFRDLTANTNKTAGADQAVRALVADGPLKERREELTKLIEQAAGLEQRYGAYTGNESVDAKAIGSDLLRLRFLYKAERFPIVWQFTFYRTQDTAGIKREWSLIALKFDTQLDAIMR
jgi:hypothetical protein